MIVTVVNIVVQPENVNQFVEATIENHQHSIREKGNLRFDVLQHRDNPSAFTLYEAYESDEAAAAHKKTAHYFKWRDTVEHWMAKPREGVAHDVDHEGQRPISLKPPLTAESILSQINEHVAPASIAMPS